MAAPATFNPALPTQKDQARLRVGDYNGLPQWFLEDATVTQLIANEGYDEACAQYAETIGATCVQLAEEVQQRNLRRRYSDRAQRMFQLADRIRNLAGPSPGDPPNFGALAGKTKEPDTRGYEALLGDRRRGECRPGSDPFFDAGCD